VPRQGRGEEGWSVPLRGLMTFFVDAWICRRSALHPAKGAAAHPWNPLAGVPPPAPRIRPRLRARLSAKLPYVSQIGKTWGATLLPVA